MTTTDHPEAGTTGRPRRRRRPGRPRGGDSELVRRQIVSAASDLIGRQGYGATSMAQVAQAAGLSATGLNHHFPSKTALLGAVLGHRDEVDIAGLDEAGHAGPWHYLDRLVSMARINAARPDMVRLFATISGEATHLGHPAHEWMHGHYDAVFASIREGIAQDQADGHVRHDAPAERIVREVIALMDGLQTQWLLDPTLDMAELLGERVAEIKERWGTGAEADPG